jgi:hypothetical protein
MDDGEAFGIDYFHLWWFIVGDSYKAVVLGHSKTY